jgi:predicted Zn-dependent protease
MLHQPAGGVMRDPTSRKVRLADLQEVYDRHRYLDAWESSAEYWHQGSVVEDLTAEEMIFAGRLASRLGGYRVSRHLYRTARRLQPDLPIVRYFTRHVEQRHHSILDDLLAFERNPELGGDDDRLRASWLASHAYSYATLRDFSRAWNLMGQAHAISPGDGWLLALESDMLGMADRWSEARHAAEQGCFADPESPWPTLSLATALLNTAEIREAVSVLSRASERSQLFQVPQTACWYYCALAETLEGAERQEALGAARRLAEQIEPLAPLADREFKSFVARTWLDISTASDDHAAMEFWSREARSPFHRKVLENLKRGSAGKRVRLSYQRTIQKHVECVPTSIASALSATGASISLEQLARAVTFGGTAEWAAADWLRENGFHVRVFSANAEIAAQLIHAGIGFTVSWDDDQSGHAVAIVGFDEPAGTLIAHDPSSFRNVDYLLSTFTERYSPLGVPAMAVVPMQLAAVLDRILPADSEVVEAARDHEKALALYGPSKARTIVDHLESRFPDHPGTHYLRAIQNLEDGRIGKALRSFRTLLGAFPSSPAVRVRMMMACRSLGDTALLRSTLESIVDTGKVPGFDSQTSWTTPHYRYISDYADLLRFSSETRSKADSLLRYALRHHGHSAAAWHVLADLRWEQRDFESALLAYRIASTLGEHDEHYARAYANALSQNGRQNEGKAWLRNRAEKLGKSVHGVSTWITLVDALEDWGEPGEALEICRSVLDKFQDSHSLLSFAIPFLGRMGEWDQAEELLHSMEKGDARGLFHEAAVFFNDMRGRTHQALEHAEGWVREIPLASEARSRLLALAAKVHGNDVALERAAQWMRERPENENFEELFCSYADNHRWRKLRVLKARAKRNPEDAWVWRELVFTLVPMFEMADERHRRRLAPQISQYVTEACRVAREDAATLRASGYWHEAQAHWREAYEDYLESVRRDPRNSFGFRRAFEVSNRLSEADRRAMWVAMESAWLGISGHLPNCLELMRLLNEAFGARETEQIILRWQTLRPDDPNVAEALADLLIEHGHGRSDAARALKLLRATVERYPYHAGLRFSLARAQRTTCEDAASSETFAELVRRRPDNIGAMIQLAWIQERVGQVDEALRTLLLASGQEPQNTETIHARAQILIENQRFDEARTEIAEGLRRLPRSVPVYQHAISLLLQCGDDEAAIEAARQGIRAYPDGAYMWLLLGRTLRSHAEFAAPGEIEECLRRSLRLNEGLFESADWLAITLTEQRRYEEARQVVNGLKDRMADPSPGEGRTAWIRYEAGEKSEAINDLSALLRDHPGYSWGWNLLISWLEQDKKWEKAKEVLDSVAPQMLTDVSFRVKRLQLLEKAKADSSSLDAEWSQLLDDFPEDVTLHLSRFDALQRANCPDAAGLVLQRIAPIAEHDVYFLARLVDVRCREGRFDEAVRAALEICFAPVEHSNWPVNHAWEKLGNPDKHLQLASAFRARLNSGNRPTPQAFDRYLEWTLDQERSGGFPKWLRQTRLHHVTRDVFSLMSSVEQSPWRRDFSLADAFATLNKHRYPRLVVRAWKEMCEQGPSGDSNEWAEVGRALVTLHQHAQGRELFRDWRNRRGVKMWSLANYIQCLSRTRRAGLNEIKATCRDALAQLPHDHCARYLAHIQAESCAFAGDRNGLLEVWNTRRPYFGGDLKPGEYFRAEDKHLRHDVPDMVEALERRDTTAYRRILWRLRFSRIWNKESRALVRQILGWVLRIIVTFYLIVGSRLFFHP